MRPRKRYKTLEGFRRTLATRKALGDSRREHGSSVAIRGGLINLPEVALSLSVTKHNRRPK